MNTGLWWLASYPKSGNTWMRAFLINYILQPDEPIDINKLSHTRMSSVRHIFDDAFGLTSVYLSSEELDIYRPELYHRWADEIRDQPELTPAMLLKVHDAYVFNTRGKPIFPPEASAGAIYILRNPLDVAVSYAHHSMRDLDSTIADMANDDLVTINSLDRQRGQVPQHYLSWRRNILSWTSGDTGIPTHIVRYEDMNMTPLEAFGAVVAFLGFDSDPERLTRAIEFSSFDVLVNQEKEHGFGEKPPGLSHFFRKGKVGSWREALNEQQVQSLIDFNREVMLKFGYLTDDGQPVY